MIMMDKKRFLTAILGPEKGEEQDDGTADPLEAVAKELIESVINHDVKGVCEAFKAAFQLCGAEPEE